MKRVRVLWVEDSLLFRQALALAFSRRKHFTVSVCSPAALMDGTARIPCDVVVIDAAMWAGGPGTLADAVRRGCAKAAVVLLAREDLLREHLGLVREGRVAVVTHRAGAQGVFEAAKAAARGHLLLENGLFAKLMTEVFGAKDHRGKAALVNREQGILDFLIEGKTNKEMAAEFGCSERTIKVCMSDLFRRTGVTTRSGLAMYAVRNGLARMR